jgi:hypothetical protein
LLHSGMSLLIRFDIKSKIVLHVVVQPTLTYHLVNVSPYKNRHLNYNFPSYATCMNRDQTRMAAKDTKITIKHARWRTL